MSSDRFEYAQTSGLTLPDAGRIAFISPDPEMRIEHLETDRIDIVSRFAPDHRNWDQRDFTVKTHSDDTYSAVIVHMPRAKDRARALVWQATQLARNGLIVIDGQKSDGIAPMIKAVSALTPIAGQVSKAHGKLIWFTDTGTIPDDWQPRMTQLDNGFYTQPGVFSADGPDPASQALLSALPDNLGRVVADFGAGWGYLSAAIAQKNPDHLHMIEADLDALDCARVNVTAPCAQLHWDDATTWTSPAPLDCVVMNPPFHTARKVDTTLGQAFITNAARNLKPSGTLWMVANRHLPYEETLARNFGQCDEIGGDNRFKIFRPPAPLATDDEYS